MKRTVPFLRYVTHGAALPSVSLLNISLIRLRTSEIQSALLRFGLYPDPETLARVTEHTDVFTGESEFYLDRHLPLRRLLFSCSYSVRIVNLGGKEVPMHCVDIMDGPKSPVVVPAAAGRFLTPAERRQVADSTGTLRRLGITASISLVEAEYVVLTVAREGALAAHLSAKQVRALVSDQLGDFGRRIHVVDITPGNVTRSRYCVLPRATLSSQTISA